MFEVNVNGRTQRYRSKPTMNVDTTGSSGSSASIPKPLTYDYMPEGYPSKRVETVTLVEEQEAEFFENSGPSGSVYLTILDSLFSLEEGLIYTVRWDSTEYQCPAKRQGGTIFIGNAYIEGGEDSGEPFICYTNNNECILVTLDTAASHTIRIDGETYIYKTLPTEFVENGTVLKNIVFAGETISLEDAQRFYRDAVLVYWYNQLFTNVRLNNNNGKYSLYLNNDTISIIIPMSSDNTFSMGNYNTVTASLMGEVNSEHGYRCETFRIRLDSRSVVVSPIVYTTGASSTDTFFKIEHDGKTGKDFEVLGDGTIKPYAIVIPSSTEGSTKKFRITVDDSGTISATEVT